MKEVWILEGRAGSYDSAHQWTVAAFSSREQAEAEVADLEREVMGAPPLIGMTEIE